MPGFGIFLRFIFLPAPCPLSNAFSSFQELTRESFLIRSSDQEDFFPVVLLSVVLGEIIGPAAKEDPQHVWHLVFFLNAMSQTPMCLCFINDTQCIRDMQQGLFRDGNMLIAGFFPFYSYFSHPRTNSDTSEHDVFQLLEENFQYVLAFLFATEEINRNPHLLPNTSLGFDLYDALTSQWDVLCEAFTWLTGFGRIIPNYTCRRDSKTVAVVTGASWAASAHVGRLLGLYKFPQLTFGSFDTILSDRSQFSSLYQVAPMDTSLPFGIVSLMLHFSWTWVGLALADDHKGTQILSDLRAEMDRNKLCIAFAIMIPVTIDSFDDAFMAAHTQIRESLVTVIIMYGDLDYMPFLITISLNMFFKWKVWILSPQWCASTRAKWILFDSLDGGLIFSHRHVKISDFTNFIQTVNPFKHPEDNLLATLWHRHLKSIFPGRDCQTLGNCLSNASLKMLTLEFGAEEMTEESYNIYNSVYAVAHSLHEMTASQVEKQPAGNGEGNVFPWQIHPFLQNTQVKNHVGEHVVLDWKKKTDTDYDILNFWQFTERTRPMLKVGTFSSNSLEGQQLILSEHKIKWPTRFTEETPRSVCSESCGPGFRKSWKEGKAACCFDCSPCPVNEISNETDAEQCVQCSESQYADTERSHCLQKAVTFLSYEDALGMALTCISLSFSVLTVGVLAVFVKHHNTPIVKANNRALTYTLLVTLTFCFLCAFLFIGQPNTATCVLQQSTFAVLFTVALSTVLAKTLTVVLAFQATLPGRMMRWLMISRAPNFIIPVCTTIQLVLCGIWLSTSPPFIDADAHSEHGHIIIVCNKGSGVAFHCVLGYLCSLALGSYTMAFLSRNLPDTFNEAKFLTFSMLVFCSVWVTFLPVYHSTKGKVMVAMEVFSILASSAGLFGCIFVPKCYIILLRPDRNSLHHVRDKSHSRRNVLLIA